MPTRRSHRSASFSPVAAPPDIQDRVCGYEGKTVAVTGASGYIGTALTAALMNTAARTLAVTRQPAYAALSDPARLNLLTADVRDRACWDEIVGRADVVFHLAGNTSVYAAAENPDESHRSTVQPVAHLIAAARTAGRCLRVVYASTATVYGLTDRLPVNEDVEPRPATVYDLHKRSAEQQLQQASAEGVLDSVSLRLANVYGPSAGSSAAADRGVLTTIAKRALGRCDLPLYGGGRYIRDYVYIDDVVRAFLTIGTRSDLTRYAFNVASGRGITIRDAFSLVAERAARVTGHESHVCEVPWPDDADPIEFRNFVGDIRSISSACGWTPCVSLTEGVDRLIEALQNTDNATPRTNM